MPIIPYARNIAFDPSFEYGYGWAGNRITFTNQTIVTAWMGATVGRCVINDVGGEPYFYNSQRWVVSAGQVITGRLQVRPLTSAIGQRIAIQWIWFNAGGTQLSFSNGADTALVDGWQPLDFTATAPATAARLEIRLLCRIGGTAPLWAVSDSFEVDAVDVRADAPLDYPFDGDTDGCYWEGTAGQSASIRPENAGITKPDATAEGATVSWSFYRANRHNERFEDITSTVSKGAVVFDHGDPIPHTLTYQLREPFRLDPLNDWIAPFMRIDYADEKASINRQVGLFSVDMPQGEHTKELSLLDYTGYDVTSLLSGSVMRKTYSIPSAGTNVCVNPSFEYGTYGWSTDSSTAIARVNDLSAWVGKYVGRVTIDAERLVNAGFETWTNSTTPGTWSKSVSGSSSVNQETSKTHSGSNACRFDVDNSNSNVQVSQTVSFSANEELTLAFWHAGSKDGVNLNYYLQIASGTHSGKYLQDDGSWNATVDNSNSVSVDKEWNEFRRTITMPNASGTVTLVIARGGSGASRSLYVDDATLITETSTWTSVRPAGTPKKRVCVDLRVRPSAAAEGNSMALRVEFYNSGGTLISGITQDDVKLNEGWDNQFAAKYTAPASTATWAIRLIHRVNDDSEPWRQGQTYDFDGVDMRVGKRVDIYIDGDQPGVTWSGTPGQSSSVASAKNFVDEVIRVIKEGGFLSRKILIEPSARTMGVSRSWPPGTTRLEIVNELLKAIGYFPLLPTNAGDVTSEPIKKLSDTEPFTTVEDWQLWEPVKEVPNSENIHNVILVLRKSPTRGILSRAAVNNDINSPTSTRALGRELVKVVDAPAGVEDGDAAEALAQQILDQSTSYERQLDIKIAPNPTVGPYHTVDLKFWTDAGYGLSGRYWVKRWEFGFTPQTAPLKLTIGRLVQFPDQVTEG